MNLKDRFFGKGTPTAGGPPIANPRLENPPAFALLFPTIPSFDAGEITAALRNYNPDLSTPTVEIEKVQSGPADCAEARPAMIGLIGWGNHVVKLAGFAAPMATSTVERCVEPAHYEMALKQEALHHAAHVLLFYAGYETDPMEQFIALSAAGAALARLGALVVLNEAAHTSVPAAVLLPHEEDQGDTLGALRNLPLIFLFAGFVRMQVEGEPGVWMRTHGCGAFHLPDLACRAESHLETEGMFHLFANILAHQREQRQSFVAGDVINAGNETFLRSRERRPDEWFLENNAPLLVLERITPEEAKG